MGRSGGAADPWPGRKLRWAKQSSCKLNRFGPPSSATGNRWSVCSRWEEVQRRLEVLDDVRGQLRCSSPCLYLIIKAIRKEHEED